MLIGTVLDAELILYCFESTCYCEHLVIVTLSPFLKHVEISGKHCLKLRSLFQLKSLTVGVEDSARECIRSALRALDLSPSVLAPPDENDASAANVNSSSLLAGNLNSNSSNNNNAGYQLWVRTKLDESPYPLIGHEVGLVRGLSMSANAVTEQDENEMAFQHRNMVFAKFYVFFRKKQFPTYFPRKIQSNNQNSQNNGLSMSANAVTEQDEDENDRMMRWPFNINST